MQLLGLLFLVAACSEDESILGVSTAGAGGEEPSEGAAGTSGAGGAAGSPVDGSGGTAGNAGVGAGGNDRDAGDASADAGAVEVTLRTYEVMPVTPPWVAYQDGEGSWQRLAGEDGVFKFPVTSPRYGVAVACDAPGSDAQWIGLMLATVAETVNPRIACPIAANPTDTVSGTVTGVPPGYGSEVDAYLFGDWIEAGNGEYSFATRSGTRDVIAAMGTYYTATGSTVRRVILLRDRQISSSGTRFDFDFATQGVDLTANAQVSCSGISQGDQVSTVASYQTVGGSELALFTGATPNFTFLLIPQAERRTGDYYAISAYVTGTGGSRSKTKLVTDPSSVELSLPPANATSAVDRVTASPYIRLKATLPDAAEATYFRVRYTNFSDGLGRDWFSIITPGWVSQQRSFTLPDFSAVSGWDNSWGLLRGSPIVAYVVAVSHSLGIAGLVGGTADPDGIEIARSEQVFTLRP